MDNFEKGGLMDGQGEHDTQWITLPNGVHIPVQEGQSREEAVNNFVKTNEFHKQNKNADRLEHPIHIYAKNKEQGKGIAITHTKKDKGATKDAIPMRENPHPEDRTPTYFIPQSKTVMLQDLSKVLTQWKLHKSDNEKMKSYRDEPFNK